MIGRVCLLLEALSIVICLHHLYGEKFKLDIKTVGFLAIDMIIMEFINHYELSKSYTMIIYPIIILYCGVRFGFKARLLVINNLLCIALIGVTQLMASFISYYLFEMSSFAEEQLLIINMLAFFIIIIVMKAIDFHGLLIYLKNKEKIVILTVGVGIAVVLFCVLEYKYLDKLLAYEYFLLFIAIVLMCVLGAQLEKYKIQSKEVLIELKAYRLYENSFNALIEDIRLRQHEFDNHISTIYSQHLLCNTYDELVKMQKDYCEVLVQDNRYNKLLKPGDHMIRGFLYGKFLEIDKKGIDISFKIDINKLDVKMPVYKIVEILGDLINNAVDALEKYEGEKCLYVSVLEMNHDFQIVVSNTSPYIPYEEIQKFFNKGYSGKGKNRGLGLYNVKKICEEYKYNVACNMELIDNIYWIKFLIISDIIK